MENMLILQLNKINSFIENKTVLNPFTKVYAIGRSLIALSTLSVLTLNDINYFFNKKALDTITNSNFIHNKINLFGIIGYDNLLVAKIFSIIILLSVILGFLPQITGLLHFWVIYSFQNSSTLLDGGEQIATIFTFLLIPLTLFDKRLNHWNSSKDTQSKISKLIGHLTFLFISLQVSFIYLNTGVEKIYQLEDWKNGTALFYIFNNPYFGLNESFLFILNPLINSKFIFFFSWWIIISHLILSYILFLKRVDKHKFLLFGIVFHSAIAFFLGLYSFSFVMIGALCLYILPYNSNLKFKKK